MKLVFAPIKYLGLGMAAFALLLVLVLVYPFVAKEIG